MHTQLIVVFPEFPPARKASYLLLSPLNCAAVFFHFLISKRTLSSPSYNPATNLARPKELFLPPQKKTILFLCAISTLAFVSSAAIPKSSPPGFLFIANQGEHTALLVDLSTKTVLSRLEVGVNGHEVAVAPDGHLAYVPIYGNSGVGKPGTDGDSIDIIDLKARKLAGSIPLGKPVRPHCAKFGPDGFLYVSAELAQALYVVDVQAKKVVGEIPTGAVESHMFVISPDGRRAYTANVGPGSVSVLDLAKRALIAVIPVSKSIQRISISPDSARVFTHDQASPAIDVLDTATNTIVSKLAVPATVYSSQPTPDGRVLVAVSPSGKLFVINLEFGKLMAALDVPKALGEVALTSDGSFAYVSCPAAGVVEVLNLSTLKLEAPIQLTPGADGLQWFPAVK
jgi:YVTN family beta-propeller protein